MMDNGELDKSLRTLRVIWGAMLASVPISLFVIPLYLGEDFRAHLAPESQGVMRILLSVASCGVILLARFLSRHMLSGRTTWSQQTAVAPHPAIQRHTAAMIIALSLSESVAIFGLVLFIMARDTLSLFVLGAVSVLSMLTYRPVREDILETARNLEMQSRRAGTESGQRRA